MRFRDRTDGGKRLAAELLDLDLVEPVVLALPAAACPSPSRSPRPWTRRSRCS